MNQWFPGTPEKKVFIYRGRGRGQTEKYVQGLKGGNPLLTPFSREGDGGRLWLDSGDIPGAGHQCIGQGVKGVDPELPPAKGAGRGTALSMVPSSLVPST